MPLNIIQHPSGHPKRVALRNNLLTDADATTIRYFTDTLTGSSGSPVFSDEWKVIGLHRGSTSVAGVSFQGRDTAVVNVSAVCTPAEAAAGGTPMLSNMVLEICP